MLNCSKENRESTKIKIPKMSWDNHCQNLDISPIQGLHIVGKRQVETIHVVQLQKELSNFIFEIPSLNCRNSRFF